MRRTDIKLLLFIALVAGLTAVVFSCGNPADSQDTEPPVIEITNPADNSVVPNAVDVRADASDNTGVVKVEFYIDDLIYFTDEVAPWSCYWTLEMGDNSEHTLFAKAFDKSGNWTASDAVTVTCENTPPAAVDDLISTDPDLNGDLTLTWTAPGDDGATGTAAVYDLRWYFTTITADNWVSAGRLEGEPTPQAAGSGESFDVTGLSLSSTYYFAIRTQDAAGNWSEVSNNAVVTTPDLLGDPFTITLQDMASSLELADLDGNLALDLIIGHRLDTNNVSVLFNDGSGNFTPPTIYYARKQVAAVVATDVDDDGDLDITAASYPRIYLLPGDSASQVSVLLNDGFGSFDLQVLDTYDTSFLYCDMPNWAEKKCEFWDDVPNDTHSTLYWSMPDDYKSVVDSAIVDTSVIAFYAQRNAISACSDDFNNDGYDDLAVANVNSSNISVLFGNGDGTFTTPMHLSTSKNVTNCVCAADFNNDGWVDIANSNGGHDQVTVFRNLGDGTFDDAASYEVGDFPESLYPADLNGDGYIDLAAANSADGTVSVLLFDAVNDRFSGASQHLAGQGSRSIYAEDLNGDGSPELTVGNFYDDNISLMLNQGQFLFYSYNTREFATGDGPTKIRCADFDGDGDADVITLNEATSSVTFLYNNLVQ